MPVADIHSPDVRFAVLAAEHDDLDRAITVLAAANGDELLIKRLKKRKLHLKDAIAMLPPMAAAG